MGNAKQDQKYQQKLAAQQGKELQQLQQQDKDHQKLQQQQANDPKA